MELARVNIYSVAIDRQAVTIPLDHSSEAIIRCSARPQERRQRSKQSGEAHGERCTIDRAQKLLSPPGTDQPIYVNHIAYVEYSKKLDEAVHPAHPCR